MHHSIMYICYFLIISLISYEKWTFYTDRNFIYYQRECIANFKKENGGHRFVLPINIENK